MRSRACSVPVRGQVTCSLPSLAVVASTVGKVAPPSVESRIRTCGAYAAALVPATSQVTVPVVPPSTTVAVACEVTRNGPAEPTVSVTSSYCVPPPVAKPSRAVRRNDSDLVAVGSFSEWHSTTSGASSSPVAAGQEPVAALVLPLRTCARSGKERLGSSVARLRSGEP